MRYLRVDDSAKIAACEIVPREFLKNTTDHPRAVRVRDLDRR
jgi:hypothetical protein